jgi:pimeloyl-ACP methyl ester carboxylesterase
MMRGAVWQALTIWELLLLALFLMVLGGQVRKLFGSDSSVAGTLYGPESSHTLIVLIHGFAPSEERLSNLTALLSHQGRVMRLDYPSSYFSNADAEVVSQQIGCRIQKEVSREHFEKIIVVAHSVGALLARKAYLDGLAYGEPWTSKTQRIVLLAGANRGWHPDGAQPLDMSNGKRLVWLMGEWLARLTGVGKFILQFQAGTPFVANLRLKWMREIRDSKGTKPVEVVQLLGDIDDVVASDDSADIRVMANGAYAFLRVRGTGHGNIIDVPSEDESRFFSKFRQLSDESELRIYRSRKIVDAVTASFQDLMGESEEQPMGTDHNVKTVVFVLHGIRDLGKWSSKFETALRGKLNGSIRIVSPRYGYLGMGPFLLPTVRDRYVRWLMDEYTETLARYPDVTPENIHFFGHSNGTYLLANALRLYSEMKVNRIVLAGSVVPSDYDWEARLNSGQVRKVRNYVATSDWVVAIFPRLFETKPVSLLGNELGAAGFVGFKDAGDCLLGQPGNNISLQNVCYVSGAHNAFEARVSEIVGFLADKESPTARTEARGAAESFLLSRATMWLVWFLLILAVVYLGLKVVDASPSPAWVMLVLYSLLVLQALKTA